MAVSTGVALDPEFFSRPTLAVARDLIGVELCHRGTAGIIVEAEAYTDDPASHYVTRRPSAGELMGATHGRVYVYQIYGLHLCLNFTTDAAGPGAVLIRSLQPTTGLAEMRGRRGEMNDRELCSGPGKLSQALGVGLELNGAEILDAFVLRAPVARPDVVTGPRVGIRQAIDLPWRFCWRDSRWLSRPLPAGHKQ